MNSFDVFIAVTELKSFSKAAKKLHRSPSAISKHIAMLEEKLGVQLVTRTTRHLTITSAGQLYYERCKDIAQRMDETLTELKDHVAEPAGKLSVTWPNVLTSSPVIGRLSAFCAQYPKIKLDATVTAKVLDLQKENIDFAFRISNLEDSNLVAIEMGKIQPIICASPDLIKRMGKPSSIEEVLSLPQVIPTYVGLPQAVKRLFPQIKGFDSSNHHEVNDITALHEMAVHGMGAAFIGRHVVEKELKSGALIDLTQDSLPSLPVYLVYQKQDYLPNRNRCFIDFFKTEGLRI